MSAKRGRKVKALAGAIALALLAFSIALALTPTVDGDDSGDWGTDPTGCNFGDTGCTRVLDDDQDIDPGVYDFYDVQHVYLTNDATYLYFRVDFWGNGACSGGDPQNTWYATTSNEPQLSICIDIDRDDGTGVTADVGICDSDESMAGADYRIEVVPDTGNLGQPATPMVHTCTGPSCSNQTATGAIGYDSCTDADTVTEIRVALADLGVTDGTCPDGHTEPCGMEIGLLYDNGVLGPPDDSIPDNSYRNVEFGGGSPTAITLRSLGARSPWRGAIPWIAIALLGLVSLGLLALRWSGRVRL
jgi:hypothetical protein